MDPGKKIGINKALKYFGGFVRYYDTTEPLAELIPWASSHDCRHILACCGGGDQALTMLGAGGGKKNLWAVDINPAQLFLLAAKASFIKKDGSMPSFEKIARTYPGKISAVKKNIRRLDQMTLYHLQTGKMVAPPALLAGKYAIVTDNEMFALPGSGPFWQKDRSFITRVKAGLGRLKFARTDIFDCVEHFEQGSLDLIYISDIFWPQALDHYQKKLKHLIGLLRLGGKVICFLDAGDDFMGEGISPGLMLARNAKDLGIKIVSQQNKDSYLVLERIRRAY